MLVGCLRVWRRRQPPTGISVFTPSAQDDRVYRLASTELYATTNLRGALHIQRASKNYTVLRRDRGARLQRERLLSKTSCLCVEARYRVLVQARFARSASLVGRLRQGPACVLTIVLRRKGCISASINQPSLRQGPMEAQSHRGLTQRFDKRSPPRLSTRGMPRSLLSPLRLLNGRFESCSPASISSASLPGM